MENGLFRKKSIDRISYPEALHDYMRVTSPRLWMILAAVVLLLGGFIVYASTARMENTMQVKVKVDRYQLNASEDPDKPETENVTYISTTLPEDLMDTVKPGMQLRIGKEEGHVSWIYTAEGEKAITVVFEMDHPLALKGEGEYDGELVLESTTPISFLWN